MDKGPLARRIGWSLLILACLVGLLFFVYNTRQSLNPPEYEGKIVDKWAGYHESDEGSRPYFRLLVEPDNGLKFTVTIDRENYQRAKVGMRIKKTRKGIELSRLAPIREELKNRPVTS
jgi:hypothetical protein